MRRLLLTVFVTVAKFPKNAQHPSCDAKGFLVAQCSGSLAAKSPYPLAIQPVYDDKPIDIVELSETAGGSRHGLIMGGDSYYGWQ
jgi:hypothetical protein